MSKAERHRLFKGAVPALATRRATVSAFVFGSQPVVEFRILDDGHHRDLDATFSVNQAREAVRLLLAAIAAADPAPCHDRSSHRSPGRAPVGMDSADVGPQASN